jgi:chlorobactene glucosyltransferase
MTFTLNDFLLALPWFVPLLLGPILIRRRPRLSAAPAVDGSAGPFVSVIVPARNEAENIGPCVAALLASRYARCEIVIVDDRSTDGTTQIVHALALQHPDRIRIVAGEPLPPDWVGKPWACWQGFLASRGDILVFTDADTRHAPALLSHAVGTLDANRADIVTLVPRQLMETFWERVILPQIFAAILFRFRDLNRMNSSRNPRDVIANGQFILVKRDVYEELGGHRAVKGEIVEDLMLAQRAVSLGKTIHAAHAPDLMMTRMYRSLGGIVEGWSKNLASASRQTVPSLLRPALPWAIGLFLLGYWAGPPVLLLTALPAGGPAEAAALATSASFLYWFMLYRGFRVSSGYAALYPLGAAAAAALFFRSASLRGKVRWKGRSYETDGSGHLDGPAP